MENENNDFVDCGKAGCRINHDIERNALICGGSSGSCYVAKLLECSQSEFHDRSLISATQAINKILEGIPTDTQGRKLSFFHTKMGAAVLIWTEHGIPIPPDTVVLDDSDDAAVAAALGLIDWDSEQAAYPS
ncbi:MAG TPA: hypothetical protein VGC97_06305 [Pyrinomonadaceae bacterium]|jgi:hypothetical protein